MSAYNYLDKADKTGQRIRAKPFLEEYPLLVKRIYNKLIKINCAALAENIDAELMEFILTAYKQYINIKKTFVNYTDLSAKATHALRTAFFYNKKPEISASASTEDVIALLKQRTGKDWKHSAVKNTYWFICRDINERDSLANLLKSAGIKPEVSLTKDKKQPIILLNNLAAIHLETMVTNMKCKLFSSALMNTRN